MLTADTGEVVAHSNGCILQPTQPLHDLRRLPDLRHYRLRMLIGAILDR